MDCEKEPFDTEPHGRRRQGGGGGFSGGLQPRSLENVAKICLKRTEFRLKSGKMFKNKVFFLQPPNFISRYAYIY